MKHVALSRWWLAFPVAGLLVSMVMPVIATAPAFAALPGGGGSSPCTWVDQATASCNGETFTQSSISGNAMNLTGNTNNTGTNGTQCGSDTLVVNNYKAGATGKMTTIKAVQTGKFGSTCTPTTTTVTFSNTWASAQPAAGGAGSGGAGNATHPECLTSGNALAWVLCPVFNLLSDASDWIFTQVVTPFLITSPISTSPSDPIYVAWSTFRMYADIFLVLALLVLVIGEAIGGGLIDAYTVRKALPRLIAAVIFVNLSIYIVAFLVDITNIVGKSIGNVLIEPFKVAKDWSFTPTTGQGVGVFGIGLIGLLATGGSIAAILTGFFSRKTGVDAEFAKIALQMVFFILIPVFLSILAVFVTLIIRKGLILFLILISPVAFALYALPGTERLFKKWWDLLLESLLIYPIVIVIFAIADILSVTILNANGVSSQDVTGGNGGSILAIIVAFVLQFLPLLAVPFAFRMAGGTLSRAHEAITNGRNKLTQSGLYATKRGDVQKRWQQQRAGASRELFTGLAGTRLGQSRVPVIGRAIRGRAERYEQLARTQAADISKDPRWAAIQDDDHALLAGTYSSYYAAVRGLQQQGIDREKAMRAASAVDKSVGFSAATQAAATQAAVLTNTTFSGYVAPDGRRVSGLEQMTDTIARASGGNRSTAASLAGFANARSKPARPDLAPGFGSLSNMVETRMGGGSDAQLHADAKAATAVAFNNLDVGTLLRAKPLAFRSAPGGGPVVGGFSDSIKDTFASSTDTDTLKQMAIRMMELQHNLPAATGDNQKEVVKLLQDVGVDFGRGDISNQIVDKLNAKLTALGRATVSRDELVGQARIYGAGTPIPVRGVGGGPPTPPAPGPGP